MLDPASFTLTACSYDDVLRLRAALDCSETLAWILVRRGITDPDEARALLHPADPTDDSQFHDPFLLGDMAAAVERIRFAIQDKQPIVVHGDYDADGVCSTTLLTEALESLGAEVRPFLPNRFTNGYGLQLDSVERFALDGARLIITVDCGITAVEPIAQAVDRGIDVIVCDHHRPGPELPPAIICSTRPSDYPFPELCATAVVGKLVQALGAPYGDAQWELEALATVADCVPLVGENRQIVRRGLQSLRRSERPGLRALYSASNVHARDLTEEDIAFRIAPRINAVGRLSESERAYELLRADSKERAEISAHLLHETNAERRRIEQNIVQEAIEQIEGATAVQKGARIYVVSGRDWHEGVVGIVASRLVDRYHRPVIVISQQNPLSRGSGRSIDGFDLHGALESAQDLLVHWGGHKAAAGLTIEPDQIDELRRRLAAYAAEHLTEADLQPTEHIDAVVSGDELSLGLVQEIEQLAPFGMANQRPRLLAVGAKVGKLQAVGEGKHLRCTVTTGGISAPAIGFGQGHLLDVLEDNAQVDACIRVSINRFRGAESLQLELDRLISLPQTPPAVLGMCATRCTFECTDRVQLEQVLRMAAAPQSAVDADASREVPLEPLLARTGTVDLRHSSRSGAHIARLATAGLTQLVVCADVSRRRDMFHGSLHPQRLGVQAAALASSRCNRLGVASRLRQVADAIGPRVVLVDYGALEQCLTGPVKFDAVVVLDPPVTAQQRDLLMAASAPLHLVFGAAETRFAQTVAAAVTNVRGTLGGAWKELRATGGAHGEDLERTLFGTGAHLHSPEAVAHGVHLLRERGLFALAGDVLQVVETDTKASADEPVQAGS